MVEEGWGIGEEFKGGNSKKTPKGGVISPLFAHIYFHVYRLFYGISFLPIIFPHH